MHDHNIRQEIRVTLEGDDLHELANYLLAKRFEKRKNPKVEVWSLLRRSTFLDYTEYPGLPDFICTTRENGRAEVHLVEIETDLTRKNLDKKLLQFRRIGVDTVDIIDLKECKDQSNWVLLEKFIMGRLSFA